MISNFASFCLGYFLVTLLRDAIQQDMVAFTFHMPIAMFGVYAYTQG
jgi:hypothetical protein